MYSVLNWFTQIYNWLKTVNIFSIGQFSFTLWHLFIGVNILALLNKMYIKLFIRS